MDVFKYPYAPNIDKILETIKNIDGTSKDDIQQDDNYYKLLFVLGILEENNNVLRIREECRFLVSDDKRIAYDAFAKLVFSLSEYQVVVSAVGAGNDIETIQQQLAGKISNADITLLLAWMEQLQLLKCNDGKYVPNDSEAENETEDSIYPLDINIEIDIKPGNYSVFEYLRKLDKGQVVLNPDFQRNEVWKNNQKSMFIESAMLNVPIPPLYFKAGKKGELIIVDGLQRTSALRDFFKDKLVLTGLRGLKSLNGYKYSDFTADEEKKLLISRVEDKMLPFYELSFDTPMAIVYDIFNRINTGGTKLERQEIRNCIYIGQSTQLLKKLASNKIFRRAINDGISSNRMKDREAILRCIAFTLFDYRTDYEGSLDSILEKSMRKMNGMTENEIATIEQDFIKVMHRTQEIFGKANFRIPTDYTIGRVNIAVMESIYNTFYKKIKHGDAIDKDKATAAFSKLLNEQKYIDAVRNSTAEKKKVERRFSMANMFFEGC